jgi:ATP adenylyltransferase
VASAGKSEGCFLCTKLAESNDEDNLLLYRGEGVFVLMNLYPYNSGHLMIVPKQHTSDLPGLEPATAAELMTVTQRCVAILGEEYHPEGFNVGMNLGAVAGAGEPGHLHVHVVPRWAGDTNFMPVVGETKVLPESLEQTYARLQPRFAQ